MLTRFTRTIALLTFTLILFAAQAVPGLAQSTIGPEDISAPVGSTVTVAVETSGFSDLDVSGYQFTATFDPTVIEVVDVSREGTISDVDGQFETNQPNPGELRVALASSDTLDGEGPLLELKVDLVGAGSTSLALTDVRFFDPNGNEVDVSGQTGTVESTVKVDVSDAIGIVGQGPVKVPIRLSSTPGAEPSSYQFTLTYDESIVEVTGVDTEGTLSGDSQADPEFNQTGPGEVKVAFASSSALEAPGALINLMVEPKGVGRTTLSLGDTFRLFELNGAEIPTRVEAGVFVSGDPATAQIIHNAADPAADTVDVYFEDKKQLDDFAFRTATPFMDVPGGVEFEIGIAPGDSEGSDDVVASQAVTFEADMAHTVVANGVMQPDDFAANPDGEGIGLGFFVESGAMETASDGQVNLRAVQGATDAPTIDLNENGTTLFEALTYGDVSADYQSVAAEEKRFVIVNSASGEAMVGFRADTLAAFGGTAATVLTSGFLNPGANQDGAAFALIAARANGDVVMFEKNLPPEFTAVPSDKSVQLGETLSLPADSIEAEDPDGDEVTYMLLEEVDGAAIDTSTGAFTFAPACQQEGMTFTMRVEASDGQAAVDTSFAVSVSELTREAISVSIQSSFGDPTVSANYKQVGLPGQVDLPIDQTLEGSSPEDWRAFWDNGGGATLDQGLVEFDGSSQFNFRPGRGFWVLARNPWTASGTFDPVSLDENCNASIPLNGEGEWTMISNPLGKDISWTAVQSENGIDDPLWQKNSGANSYSQSQTFTSASDGGAFYFLNVEGLQSLKIPYFESAGESLRAKKEEDGDTGQLLGLTVLEEETPQSSIWVGLRADAKEGLDDFDHFAPPSYFRSTTLELSNKRIDVDHSLAFDVRPADSDGQTFNLKLRTEPGTTLRLTADGLDQFGPNQMVRLYDPARAETYHLDAPVEVTPETKVTDLALVIGDRSYVKQQESEFTPDQIKLHQNYPNPFHQQTTLKFALPEKTDVRLEVYDLLGRRVQTLVNGERTAGIHTLQWKGQTENGKRLASGTYLVRLQAGDQTRTGKMVLVR